MFILTWIIGLLGGKTRATLIGIAAVAVGWYLVHSKTVAYQDGKDAGRIEAYYEARSRMEAATTIERARIAQERSELDTARQALTYERNAVQAQRRDITAVLNAGISTLAGRDVEIRNEISNTSDTAVDDRFRLALARAKLADARLAVIRAIND